MDKKLEQPALQILEMLRKVAPKMELSKAYDHVEHYQELRDHVRMTEFIIMMLLWALGMDENGRLSDKEIAEQLKNAPDEIWIALKLSLNIHAGYVCSPFTLQDWMIERAKEYKIKNEDLLFFKENQLKLLSD